MKLLTAISLLTLSLSTFASGGMFKNRDKFNKACAQGNLKKLKKYEAMGFEPNFPLGRDNPISEGRLQVFNTDNFLTNNIYGNAKVKNFNFDKQAICFDWFYREGAVFDVNHIYEEVSGGFIQFYNVGLLGEMLVMADVDSREDETHIMNWARLFVNKYGYNTQNLYPNNRGVERACDLSLAVGSRFTLKSIKELVNMGFIHSGECLSVALGIAESREMVDIANYLKSL